MTFTKIFQLLCAAALSCMAVSASTVFNFDNDSVGTSTTFTDTVNGLSATFSSSADPGGFVVYSSIFSTLTGNVLGDPGPAGLDSLALDVSFNQELTGVNLDFATSDFDTPSPLTLDAYQNDTFVGSSSATGSFISGFSFPEGEISLAGASFNNLVISSTATDFAVDNIAVSQTPEPRPCMLFALGLLVIGFPAFRSTLRHPVTSN